MKKIVTILFACAALASCDSEIPELNNNNVVSRVITEEQAEEEEFVNKFPRWPWESSESWMRRCRKAYEDQIKEANREKEKEG